MTLPPFEAPRLKLRRARHHIADLSKQIDAYLAREPFYLEIADARTDDGFPLSKKWVVRVREEVPVEFSAIIGDAIHNLRTALDVLACELVRVNGGNDKGVHFPFADSATELPAMIKRWNMDRAKPTVVALIVTTAPFKGGNEALRALHDLDIMDKHQAIIPTSDMTGVPDIPGLDSLVTGYRAGPIRDGMGFGLFGTQAALPLGFQAKGTLRLNFQAFYNTVSGLEVAPLRGGEVVPTLTSLADHVAGLVEAFILVA